MDRSPLGIRLLGTFELYRGDIRVEVDSPRVQSLVAYLALHPGGPQPRQRIAFLFWPDSTEKQAQTNLRNVLFQLRRVVPDADEYLRVRPRTLAWRDTLLMSSDVDEFERALDLAERAQGAAIAVTLDDAIARYGGDLMPACYDDWLLTERDRLRQRYAAALERLLLIHEATGEHDQMIAVAYRLLRHDPFREDAHRALIVAYTGRGDRARALRAYHDCAAVLERELGVAPGRLTRRAYDAALGLDDTVASSGSPDPAGVELRPTRPSRSLVGREREWAEMMHAWRAATTTGSHVVVVSGEAGIGKTRLVEEFVGWLVQQGHASAAARSYAAEGALAYAPVIEWLRSDALRRTVATGDDATRFALACLLPDVVGAPSQRALSLGERERRRRIHDAVLRVVRALQRPLALIADDLQWCDRETLELIHHLVRSARAAPDVPPVVIFGTVRHEEVDPGHALYDVLPGLAAIDRATEIRLERLDRTDTGTLAAQVVRRTLDASELGALHRQTDGNPLFVIETLRTNWPVTPGGSATPDGETVEPSIVSPKVQAIIEARLRQLSPQSRRLAEIAATFGREFAIDVLSSAADTDDVPLLRSLDELWRRGIIRAAGTDAYDFSHDRIREVAYAVAGPVRRRELHLRIARALEALRATDTAAAGQLAWHYDRAGASSAAVGWYNRAADAAQRLSALDAAAGALRRALALLERLPPTRERDERELHVRLKLGASLVALRGYAAEETAEIYRGALVLCERLQRPVPPPVLRALALVGIATSDLAATESFGAQLVAGGDGDDLVAVEGQYVLGVAAFWRGRLADARSAFERALTRYRAERHPEHIALYAQDPKVVCLSRLAWTLWLMGMSDAAISAREESIQLARELAHPYSHAYALWFTMFIAIDDDDHARVREQVSSLERVASKYELVYIGAIVDSFVGYRAILDGDVLGGIARMEAALSDPRAAGQDSVLRPQTLLLLARAHEAGGDPTRGLEAVTEALAIAARGAHVWESDLHRIRARLLVRGGADDWSVRAAFAQALDAARTQGARRVELATADDLERWQTERSRSDAATDSRRPLHGGQPGIPASRA